MDQEPGLDNRRPHIASKIRSLLTSLPQTPQEYDREAPKIEFWIEYVLHEGFMTVDELVKGVSWVAWESSNSANVARFLKEFRDAPHRSEQARPFVDKLCEHVLRWFAIASVEELSGYSCYDPHAVARCGGEGFLRAALFVGHFIEQGLVCHELVRRHLVRPLIAHKQNDINVFRAGAIYQLFVAAGNTLLRGLLGPEDVQVCFETLNAQMSHLGKIVTLDTVRLQVRCATHSNFSHRNLTFFGQELREIHTTWLEQMEKEEQRDATGTDERKREEEDTLAAEPPTEVETPVAFVPRDLPLTAVGIDAPSSSSILHDVESSPEIFFNIPSTAISSPTLSISTVSDLTPTELGEEVEHSEERTTARHDTLYFEDGNVEIACGDIVFRVHSTIVSLSSSKLRDILSPSALLNAPTPEGCPRIASTDSAEDFAVLLKTIYTPGYVLPPLDVGSVS